MKIESACATLTVYHRRRHHSRIVRVGTSHGNRLAAEVQISIACASVCAGIYEDNITIASVVYTLLDIVVISGAICIDSDCSCTAGNG